MNTNAENRSNVLCKARRCYFLAFVLTYFRLTKGCVILFQLETVAGYFLYLMMFFWKVLINYFENCGKNNISWNIHNQIIETCDSLIKQEIVTVVNNTECFKILADNISSIK